MKSISSKVISLQSNFMKSSQGFCLIKTEKLNGSGFFLHYQHDNKIKTFLLTSSQIITEDDVIKSSKITLTILLCDKGKITKIEKLIQLDKSKRFIWISGDEEIDLTVMEMIDSDNITTALELDNQFENQNTDPYINNEIIMFRCSSGKGISFNLGKILNKTNQSYQFEHNIKIDKLTYGGPIISLNNFKVIGIQSSSNNSNKNNGIFIFDIISKLLKLNHSFLKEPQNLKFKENVITTNDYYGRNDIFEVYVSPIDLEVYLISKNTNHNLEIYRLKDKKLIKSIQHHSTTVSVVRYFYNKKNKREYVISADENKIVTLWDFTNSKFEILFDIHTGCSARLYSGLLVFDINNKDYCLTCSTDCNYTKLYSLDNGEFIKNIKDTNSNYTYYLLYWFNKNNNEHYIIETCQYQTAIHNLLKDDTYARLKGSNEYRHMSGFLYTKNDTDYLCNGVGNGYIHIWNLFNKTLEFFYVNSSCYLHHIIKWNNKYAIIADVYNCSFKILDYEEKKYVTNIGGYHSNYVISIKKVYHPLYGECLLSSGWDYTIKLWSFE